MTMKRIALLLLLALLAAGPAFAQEPAKPTAAQDGFVPVDSPIDPNDTISAPLLVGAAYGFIWICLFGYLWSVRRRLATVEREMEAITRRVASGRK
jgi:CcmD family protein